MTNGTATDPANGTSIDSAHSSTMASDQLTAGLAAMDVNARLPNFPVPRELRDQIYGYLLHSDYTRVPRVREPKTDAVDGPYTTQAYRFQTNILAVNKAIHKESEEYLYKNNVFVVVSAEWLPHDIVQLPSISLFSANFWTPLITETKAVKMRHHSVRMHITKGRNEKYDSLEKTRKQGPIQSCLAMADDLELFSINLRAHVSKYPGFHILIDDGFAPNAFLTLGVNHDEGKVDKPSRLKIQFRDTPFRARNAGMQFKTMDTLRNVSCAGMRVTFDGVLPEHFDHSERTRDVMGPTLVSRQAIHWESFETIRKSKQLIDEAVGVDELYLTVRSYCLVAREAMRYVDALDPDPNVHALPVTLPVVLAFHVLRFDLQLTLNYLQLRLGRLSQLDSMTVHLLGVVKDLDCSALQSTETTSTTPESPIAAFSHLAALSKMYLERMHYPDIPSSITVGKMVEALTPHKHLPYHAHDLAILSQVPNQGDLALQHLPLHKCSVSVLPPRRFCYHLFPKVPRKPEHIIGLQDPDTIRRLDHGTKMAINNMQRHYRQTVTKWE
jgi:hypothetical protein